MSLLSLFILSSCGNLRDGSLILLDDAEEGLSPNWHVIRGDTTPERIKANNGSKFCIKLPVNWDPLEDGNFHNPHEYALTFPAQYADSLEVDIGGIGVPTPHYVVGVRIQSDDGERTLLWDSFYAHEKLKSKITYRDSGAATLIFPSPVELVRGYGYEKTTTWSHFSANIVDALHHFEPNNKLQSIDAFVATGGNLDNISLLVY